MVVPCTTDSLTTFSPSGKLAQIEYALNAVGAGNMCLGIKASDGVVIATDCSVDIPAVLVDRESLQKIAYLTPNAAVSYAGMGPDFRVLVAKGRKAAQQYWLTYKEQMPVGELVKALASVAQEFTQSGGVRPFGVSLLVAGFDEQGPQLYQIDPSGSYFAWKASAVGKGDVNAKEFLKKRYKPEMELDDAIHTAILALKDNSEGALDPQNVQIGIVGADQKFRVLSQDEVKDYIQEVL